MLLRENGPTKITLRPSRRYSRSKNQLMFQRIPEPELMEAVDQVAAYAMPILANRMIGSSPGSERKPAIIPPA